MVNMADYFTSTQKTELAKFIKTEKDALNFRHSMDFKLREPAPDKGFYTPSTQHQKRSYRASYPRSKRESQDCPRLNEFHPSGTSSDSRKSLLREPQQFEEQPQSNSPSPKHVHFEEQFEPHGVQTIGQHLVMMRARQGLPVRPTDPVVIQNTDAAHKYPVPVIPPYRSQPSMKSMHGEIVDGRTRSNSYSRPLQSRTASSAQQSDRPSSYERRHSGSMDHTNPELVPSPQPNTPRCTCSCHVSPTSKRSSHASQDTLFAAEVTWASAPSVMLAKSQQPASDFDKPVVYASKEMNNNNLRRSDAQRLPKLPRRQKLLRNLSRMFD